ncbi:hypothetical protein LQ938_12045 [Microbacterium sp. cx-55]|uniref:hypothetical protein n=1 Tax=Microbacterium sp. cx-55 TaxID=2875948 RepID=UPI001CBAEB1E|nr:hypothetical protein [Microbacterium sp. cx-55]MBZ4487998.1 hypothetical protein [Microbacterium sp. cx-55]UGB34596.1 hypothetical protein LQ938_12045 [Microbacterium sp. cx-55]
MAAFNTEFARHPDRFRNGRSWPRTIIMIVIAVAALVAFVYRAINFGELQDQAVEATGSVRFVAGQRIGLLVSPILLVLVAAACVFAAIRWGRVWSMVGTGTRLRRRHRRGMFSGRRLFDDMVLRLKTGDPSTFTPLPTQPCFVDVDLEFWTADADRVGFAKDMLLEETNNQDVAFAEPIAFEGASYDALKAAIAQGFDERAAPPVAPGPGPVAPGTSAPTGPTS